MEEIRKRAKHETTLPRQELEHQLTKRRLELERMELAIGMMKEEQQRKRDAEDQEMAAKKSPMRIVA